MHVGRSISHTTNPHVLQQATSADGTKVPYFLVAPESVELNGKQPTLLFVVYQLCAAACRCVCSVADDGRFATQVWLRWLRDFHAAILRIKIWRRLA